MIPFKYSCVFKYNPFAIRRFKIGIQHVFIIYSRLLFCSVRVVPTFYHRNRFTHEHFIKSKTPRSIACWAQTKKTFTHFFKIAGVFLNYAILNFFGLIIGLIFRTKPAQGRVIKWTQGYPSRVVVRINKYWMTSKMFGCKINHPFSSFIICFNWANKTKIVTFVMI